jgi:hypothetical protein
VVDVTVALGGLDELARAVVARATPALLAGEAPRVLAAALTPRSVADASTTFSRNAVICSTGRAPAAARSRAASARSATLSTYSATAATTRSVFVGKWR